MNALMASVYWEECRTGCPRLLSLNYTSFWRSEVGADVTNEHVRVPFQFEMLQTSSLGDNIKDLLC